MADRPKILLAHLAGIDFFTPDHKRLIAEVGDLLNDDALGDWTDPGADDLLAEASVILGHWGCPSIDHQVVDRAPHLGLIAYAAGTLRETVRREVFDRDLRITSGAIANAEPVAEFTLATILFANKDIFFRRDAIRDRTIKEHRQSSEIIPGNWDKTIGIIGASIIGRRVIELLRPFPRLRVVLYDPFVNDAEATRLGVEKVDLDELCRRSEIVSVHAPDLPSTHHMIGPHQLAAMRTGSTLINTARGALVDHDALIAELEDGRLSAVLDVTDPEPVPKDSPLRTLPNVFLTPHIAGSQGTELGRMAETAVEEIRRWAAGEPALNQVTADQLARLA